MVAKKSTRGEKAESRAEYGERVKDSQVQRGKRRTDVFVNIGNSDREQRRCTDAVQEVSQTEQKDITKCTRLNVQLWNPNRKISRRQFFLPDFLVMGMISISLLQKRSVLHQMSLLQRTSRLKIEIHSLKRHLLSHRLKPASSGLYNEVYESAIMWGIEKIRLPNAISNSPKLMTSDFECRPPKQLTGMHNRTYPKS